MTRYKWLNRLIAADLSGLHILAGCLFVLLYGAGYLIPIPGLMTAGAAGLFCIILLFLLHLQFHECDHFLSMHPATDHIPKAQMKLVNGVYLAVFLAVTGAAMALFSLVNADWLLNGLKSVLGAVLRFFARLIPEGGEETMEAPASEPFVPPAMSGEAADPSMLAKILDAVLYVFAAVIIVLLAVYLVRQLFLLVIRFLKPREDGDEKEFIKPASVFGSASAPRGKEKPLWRDFSMEGRIRRAYKKEILKRLNSGEKISQTETPDELENKTDFPENPSVCSIYHQLYEKARYGNGCTKEDWELLRSTKDNGGM